MVRTLSTKKRKALPETPQWVHQYRKNTALIEVIEMAFDPDYTDKQVRKALIEVSEQLGAAFSTGGPPT